MPKQNDLESLRNLISEAQTLLMTTNLPEGRSQRANELLTAALALADEILKESPAALGAMGGKQTAKKGSNFFREIAAKRKAFKGGRPPRTS
jgi:hypothetical protein